MSATPRGSGRERILHLLKTQGPSTVARLAQRLGVTRMAVRQHLAVLRSGNLVEFSSERRSVGRPPRVWRLATKASSRFPDHHAELAVGLLEAAEALLGKTGLRRLNRRRIQGHARTYRARMPGATSSLATRVATLTRIRRDEGYMAEWRRRGRTAFEIVENHCSIGKAAGFCPSLCEDELWLFRAVLGDGVEVNRIDHILAGDRRCRYHVVPRGRGSTDSSRNPADGNGAS